jgi:threonine dehydrogenase-like Zn-dependent dehydrogenase
MRAMTYHGAHDVRVESVPDPILEAPDDIILRVTATAICGSDLHLYRGKVPTVEHGDIFGHEFMASSKRPVLPSRPWSVVIES